MSKTIVFARKTVTHSYYEMTKEEFIKDHCSDLSDDVANKRWETLCSKSKPSSEKNENTVWLNEEDFDSEVMNYADVEEFINVDMNPEWEDTNKNPKHHCLFCGTKNENWEERRFCDANCEDEFLFHMTAEEREQKIKVFIKTDSAFAETM